MTTQNLSMDGTWKTAGVGSYIVEYVGAGNLEWLIAADSLDDAAVTALGILPHVDAPTAELGRTVRQVLPSLATAIYFRALTGTVILTPWPEA